MNNKSIIAVVILLLSVLSLVLVYSFEETDDSTKTPITVYSEGPIPLTEIIKDIKTAEYYEGYDNETLAWMESLGNKQVFVSDDAFVVMNEEFIECNVLENHSIGNVKYPKDVLLVEDVDYLGQEVHDLQGS